MGTVLMPLLWVAFTSLMSQGMYRKERVLGKPERRATWLYALMVMGPIIVMAIMRSTYFGDTYTYVRTYLALPESIYEKKQWLSEVSKDKAFYAFEALISVFAGGHARVFLMIIAIIQGFCLMKVYRRYSCDFWFSIFVFVASTDIFSWMYNGIRQFTAVSISFLAAGYIFRKKYIRAMLVVGFASLFHQSALLVIPVIFVVQGKPWNWKTLLIIVGTLVAMMFSGAFTGMLDSALQDTQYRNAVRDWTSWQDDGTNPLRVLVYSVPTILSLFCRKKIQASGDRSVQIACNMGIVSTAIYMISMVTSGIFMGRLPIYFSLYANGILLPWELKYVFGKSMKTVAIVCYVMFSFIQLFIGWG